MNDPVTARGICWNTAGKPAILDSKTNDGTRKGRFTSVLNNLKPTTFYFVRAYAINGNVTAFGSQVNFMTLKI